MLRCWDSKNFACEKNGLEQDSLPSTPIKLPIIQNHRFYLANFLLHTSPSNFYFNIRNSLNQKSMFFQSNEKWEVVYFFWQLFCTIYVFLIKPSFFRLQMWPFSSWPQNISTNRGNSPKVSSTMNLQYEYVLEGRRQTKTLKSF